MNFQEKKEELQGKLERLKDSRHEIRTVSALEENKVIFDLLREIDKGLSAVIMLIGENTK